MIPTEEQKKEYEAYRQTEQWKQLRLDRKHYDGNRCVVCGKKISDCDSWDCHHLTYAHIMNEPLDDLATLCRDCHAKAHEFEDMRKHTTAKEVYRAGFMYIVESRRKERGTQGLLELRNYGIRGYGNPPHKKERGWQILRDATSALFAKAFDMDSEYAKDYDSDAIQGIARSYVAQNILKDIGENGFSVQQAATALSISPQAARKIFNMADCFYARWGTLVNG